MFGSWVGLGATSYGITGIPGYLIINKPLLYTILLAISGGIAFVLTTIIWKEEVQEKPLDAEVLSCDKGEVIQPVYGEVIPASEIEDAVFAQETMGPSVGIRPKKGEVYAPFDGEVVMVFPTNHAIGLKSEGGIELLIHIGVDTVNMNGDGFTSFVQAGDKVKKGDQLISFDLKKIKAANHPDTTIVAITNGFDVKDVKKIK